jgi:MFS family permease
VSQSPRADQSWSQRVRRTVLADITPLRQSADFRRLFVGQLVSTIGSQVTITVVFLQIYSISQSNFAVGLTGSLTFVPLILAGLYGGSVADAHDRRLVALWTTAALTGGALLFAGIAFAELRVLWPLYVLYVVQSCLAAIAQPTRMAIIPRIIPLDQLPAANALSQISWNVGLMLGPVVGASLAAGAGFGWAYLLDSLTFVVALYAYWRLPSIPADDTAHRAGARSVLEGLRYLKGKRNLQMTFYVDIVAMTFGMPRVLFAAVPLALYGAATVRVGSLDIGTAGLLWSSMAFGAVVGAVASGWFGRVQRQGRAVVAAIVVWGAAIAAFGLTANLWLGLLALAVAGGADMVSAVFRNTILQASTPDALLGRLQGVLIAVVTGGPLLGDQAMGAVADVVDVRFALIAGGIAVMVGVGLLCLAFPSFLRYDARHPEP